MRIALMLSLLVGSLARADCTGLLDYQHPLLRSDQRVSFCERFTGKVLLVVNTASRCGFTPQFEGLEALYQTYREQGLEIVGFPSNDFRQEYAAAEQTAKVCYVNYGVTFTMLESSSVTGTEANGFFRSLIGGGAAEPRWNFYKYLIDRNGQFVKSFPSQVRPTSPELVEALKPLL
ncbi:glutathione peroxidase [Litorivivens sp.]|uniref:glutathione peroxidase n=1 Tax=Litorivivens sp. TaxID=2020868 RepID=UPI00356701C4